MATPPDLKAGDFFTDVRYPEAVYRADRVSTTNGIKFNSYLIEHAPANTETWVNYTVMYRYALECDDPEYVDYRAKSYWHGYCNIASEENFVKVTDETECALLALRFSDIPDLTS